MLQTTESTEVVFTSSAAKVVVGTTCYSLVKNFIRDVNLASSYTNKGTHNTLYKLPVSVTADFNVTVSQCGRRIKLVRPSSRICKSIAFMQ